MTREHKLMKDYSTETEKCTNAHESKVQFGESVEISERLRKVMEY